MNEFMIDNKYDRIYVIGDIHGCALELNLLLQKLPLTTDSLIIFIGDYLDRGEDSKGVIDLIIKLKKTYDIVTLKGNHEQMFLDFYEDKNTSKAGLSIFNGAGATLASYGDGSGNYIIPEEHIDFLKSLELYYETENYLFVHAGLPDIDINKLRNDKYVYEEDLLWIRESFFKSDFNWNKLIIHGHTPRKLPEITSKRINIDTGCVYQGRLTALKLPEKTFYSVPKQEESQYFYFTDRNSRRKAVRFKGNMPIRIPIARDILEFRTIGYSEFQTANYSEFGILMYNLQHNKEVLAVNQKISGIIGNEIFGKMQFEGVVLRCEKKSTGFFYAIKFTKPPKELEGQYT